MPRHPWLVGRAGYKKQCENYRRTLSYYKRYQALLAKERRRRATAEKRARQHMLVVRELKRRLSKIPPAHAGGPIRQAELEP